MKNRKHQDAILEHLATYWMATYASVRNILGEGVNVESTMERLRDDRLIASTQLYPGAGKDIYFHLTKTGADLIGQGKGEPIKSPGKRAERFAVLQFCCYGPQLRHKLSRDVFDTWLPGYRTQNSELQRSFPNDSYFIDESDPTCHRLGRIVLIVPSRENMNKLRHTLFEKSQQCFPDFFDADRFSFAVLTATERGKNTIEAQLAAEPLIHRRRPVSVHVEKYPLLTPLLAKPTEDKPDVH